MAQDTLAPWAEIVPGRGRMTIDEMMALPDDGWMYELVDGRLIRMPYSGGEASRIAVKLASALLNFVDANDLGAITGADGEFDLTQPADTDETALAPDVAFVRSEHVPAVDSPQYKKAWPVAPDLVVEVVSPSQYRPEMAAKARRYLDAGVRLLWMVWPKYQQVDIWRAGASEPVATLGISDMLDGADVLPGFTYPIVRLFH